MMKRDDILAEGCGMAVLQIFLALVAAGGLAGFAAEIAGSVGGDPSVGLGVFFAVLALLWLAAISDKPRRPPSA